MGVPVTALGQLAVSQLFSEQTTVSALSGADIVFILLVTAKRHSSLLAESLLSLL